MTRHQTELAILQSQGLEQDERNPMVDSYVDFNHKIAEIVSQTLDPHGHYQPMSAAQDIASFAAGQTDGTMRYGDPGATHRNFEKLQAEFANADPSLQNALIIADINYHLQPRWDRDSYLAFHVRQSVVQGDYDHMEEALNAGDQEAYGQLIDKMHKINHISRYARDDSTFLSYDANPAIMHLTVTTETAETFAKGSENWQRLKQDLDQIGDPDLAQVAQDLLEKAGESFFYGDAPKDHKGAWIAAQQYSDAWTRLNDAAQNYEPSGESAPDAPFTRWNVDTAYLYQHAFNNPDRQTPEHLRLLYDNIANQAMPHLRYAQDQGDPGYFDQVMARTSAYAEYVRKIDDAGLDYYADDAPHSDQDNHNPEYLKNRMNEVAQLAPALQHLHVGHPLAHIGQEMCQHTAQWAFFLLHDQDDSPYSDDYEETLYRLMVTKQVLQHASIITDFSPTQPTSPSQEE